MLSAGAAGVTVLALAVGRAGLVDTDPALGVAIIAGLIAALTLAAGLVLDGGGVGSDRPAALGFSALCFAVAAVPLLLRVFPGAPLIEHEALSGPTAKLPLQVPTGGNGRLDLVTEGQLPQAPSGASIPVHYSFTVAADGDAVAQTVTGEFSEELRTQRLGRRGTTVVHQQHVAEHHILHTDGRAALTVATATVEPQDAPPVFLTAYPRRLPAWPIATLLGIALLAGAVYIDRLPSLAAGDGTFTLTTGALLGVIFFFTTDNAARPGFGTLIGATILGGAVGMGVGGLVWWMQKRLVPATR